MKNEKKRETNARVETSIKALEEYHSTGTVTTTHCEQCGDLLQISPMGNTAWRMTCTCGTYNDVLRGL